MHDNQRALELGTAGHPAPLMGASAPSDDDQFDRVLLWNHYVVPQWTYSKTRTARWDCFGKPEPMPIYGSSASNDLVVGPRARCKVVAHVI